MSDVDVQVVVVGAGLSGLVAARRLQQEGVDVVVLESADRVGGRSMSVTTALGSRLDLGGQWIGHDHHRVKLLAAELGLTEFRMRTPAAPALRHGPRRLPYLAPSSLLAVLVLAVAALLGWRGAPRRWTSLSVDRALRRVPCRRTRRLLEVIALISWTADLDRVSVFTAAQMIRAQGGVRTMLSTKGGAQEGLLVEGAGSLAERIAADLGHRVHLGEPVLALDRDETGVTVRTPARTLRAVKVVVSVPPPIAHRIEHQPPLPEDRVRAEKQTFMGSVYKAIAVYPDPWWRARGDAELIDLGDPGCAVFDSSPPDGPGHLCFLVGGAEARSLDALTEAERRALLLGAAAAHLGADALEPAGWHEKAWHVDEHVGGGYLALPDLGAGREVWPPPSAALGHLHWAGTESAVDHPGYLDGAIEAGERAAGEVLGDLR
ncbi:flavin monoamine oxidase family protein [Nocardioides stalactiti]|uniref:flavin monoamine oxidase family protein n=1 Tax=Nocardioides stalactiti TaxID=2755356 RepID=UPI0016010F5E|nr:FAD-dependent oxidoreductase [Nocardioides stalactiti]